MLDKKTCFSKLPVSKYQFPTSTMGLNISFYICPTLLQDTLPLLERRILFVYISRVHQDLDRSHFSGTIVRTGLQPKELMGNRLVTVLHIYYIF